MNRPVTYKDLVSRLKTEIHTARIQASLSVNMHLLVLYWKIGKTILQHQQAEGWGAKIIDNLSHDLKSEFPDMKGISPRNLKYMRAFAEAYPQFVQQPAAQIDKIAQRPVGQIGQQVVDQLTNQQIVQVPLAQLNELQTVQAALAQITWYHHITLLDKVKEAEEGLFYIQQTAQNGWSRNVMVHQIESGLYHRKGGAVTNFETTLPKPQSDLAKELLKDPYTFDFLSLGEEYKERDLEHALTDHITKFLLELGTGFSFVGRQYHVEIGGDDFYIDLLFYHLKLRCFVVIELKTGKFIPEYAGKLNFYLNIIDDILKHATDQPSIGIIICNKRNKVVAEYALRGMDKPTGVSEYQLTEKLPAALKGKLPTVEQIEEELKDISE